MSILRSGFFPRLAFHGFFVGQGLRLLVPESKAWRASSCEPADWASQSSALHAICVTDYSSLLAALHCSSALARSPFEFARPAL